MSRPQKKGLDYFPLEVSNDDKLDLIEAEFGLIGFAVVIKLFQRIYSEEGYYCNWNDEVALMFARKCGVGVSAVSEIVSASIRRGIFDRDLFKRYGILTSRGVQKRYFAACNRRKQIETKKGYLLISVPVQEVYVDNNSVNVCNNSINVCNNPQSKVKKSKEEYIEKEIYKEKERKRPDKPVKHKYGLYKNVLLSDEDMQKLQAEFPDYKERIDRLSEYMDYKGTKYKNHLSTIRAWARKDEQAKKTSAPTGGNVFLDLYKNESEGF